jgi:hypothetical protein
VSKNLATLLETWRCRNLEGYPSCVINAPASDEVGKFFVAAAKKWKSSFPATSVFLFLFFSFLKYLNLRPNYSYDELSNLNSDLKNKLRIRPERKKINSTTFVRHSRKHLRMYWRQFQSCFFQIEKLFESCTKYWQGVISKTLIR